MELLSRDKRTRGAVSVFLIVILVPCLLVTSVFVDLGRVKMSNGMAESAADLSLNSLLSNYDADLSEWYGMAASCQSIEEFYKISAQFFLRTITSQGLSDEEIILLSDYYANVTSDDTIYDLLQVECQTAIDSMITAVPDANLTNATLIKDQLVEFMKYRAPIALASGVIERLKRDPSIGNALDTDVNKELVDSKTEYYEAEGELLKAAFNSHLALMAYYNKAFKNNASDTEYLDNEKLKSYAEKLDYYKSVYADIYAIYVSNLCNTSGLTVYKRVVDSVENYSFSKSSKKIYTSKWTETVGDNQTRTYYEIDIDRVDALLDELEESIYAFENAIEDFEDAVNDTGLMKKLPGTGNNDSNAIQWWVQMNNAVASHTTKVKNAAAAMLSAYAKVEAITKCDFYPEPEVMGWGERAEELQQEVEELEELYLGKSGSKASSTYLSAVSKLESVSSANINKIKYQNLSVKVDGQDKKLSSALYYVYQQLMNMRGEMNEYIKLLNVALNGNENDPNVPEADRVKSLDSLLTLVETYNRKYRNWESTAKYTDTQMAEEDLKEIEEIERVCGELTADTVRELKTRLINIRSQLQAVVTGIDSMKFGTNKNAVQAVKSISGYTTFETQAKTGVNVKDVPLTNQELKTHAANTFQNIFKPTGDNVLTLQHLEEPNYNPTIDPISGRVNTPKLFVFFYSQFAETPKNQVQEQEDNLTNAGAEGNKKQEQAKNQGRYHGGGENISPEFSGGTQFNLLDGLMGSMLDLFDCLINLEFDSVRDDLYATTYIMEMFSYATYENEGLYGLVEKKTELKLKNYPDEYEKVMGVQSPSKSEVNDGKWLSTNYKDGYNKSLTNHLINKTNNAAYCAEVEYILYGGTNKENVKDVYSNIYGIRYTMNLVSGFANFWVGTKNLTATAIEAVALGIAGLTMYIIPPPVTKLVLIPILTAFETAVDLNRLEVGFPVEMYKTTHEDWWVKVPGASDMGSFMKTVAADGAINSNPDKGIFYSDYLMVFVYLGLKGHAAEDMYQRVAEVMQTNMRKLTRKTDYSMKNAQVYFKLEATLRVKPLMITLPIFSDYENDMDQKTDWCTYKISLIRGYS